MNGSPDLDAGRLLLRLVARELLRRHRRAVDAVAPRLGADVDDGISRARSDTPEDAVGSRRFPALKTLTRMLPS